MHEWQVLVVHPDCQVEERIETAEALGLAPRDTSLFAPQPLGVSGQRATIVPRENALLVRTEIARAIIHQDKTVLFPCRKDRDTLRLTQSIINNVSEAGPLPFELRVLEALLDETARQFERRQRRLELLAMSIEEDIQKTLKQNGADLQRLLPIQRALTELVHDVKEAEDAIAGVLDDDQALAAICLSEKDAHQAAREGRQAPSMRLAAALLGSYERQIQSVEGALREMSENLEVFREVWSMHLSATRNRIIRINLIVTVASFALTACIVPASFFGMNLPSGLEEHDTMFWSVVGLSAVASASLFAGIYVYWKYYPHTRHQRRVNDLKALRDLLLYHVDDLEDILAALQERPEVTAGMAGTRTMMGRDEFTKLVQSSIQDCQVRKDEIDLLYNLLDINRDGLLELKEVVKSQERLGRPFDDTIMRAAARAA
ncbi:g5926 [Coccomyxa viridis]|uniref:Magnesium transporter n=1 Tax=Coccomyxa viridis TaxID=1274662 RepID=A0ABP1FWR0_9CHLO